MNIPIHEILTEADYDAGSSLLSGVILQAGLSKNGNFYPPDVLAASAPKFIGLKCFIDHARDASIPGERSVRDVCGIVEDCRAEDGKLKAVIRVSGSHDWIASMVREGILGDVSINALGRTRLSRRDGRVVREVTEISKAYSVDFVTDAAAGGRVSALLRESEGYAEGLRLIENMTLTELKESRPDLVERVLESNVSSISEDEDPAQVESDVRHKLIEGVIRSRNIPDEISGYLANALKMMTAGSDGVSADEINRLVEEHLNYLGQLSASNRLPNVTKRDPLSPPDSAKASTIRLLRIGR